MKEYKIDLATLLPLLAEVYQQGFLSTVLPIGFSGLKERCAAQINLVDGQITLCQLIAESGQIYATGDKALHLFYSLGVCNWRVNVNVQRQSTTGQFGPLSTGQFGPLSTGQFGPLSISTVLAQPAIMVPATPTGPVPIRTAPLDPNVMNGLPRHQKRIFMLVDGTRTVEKIAQLIAAKELQEVALILKDLETMGLITFKNETISG